MNNSISIFSKHKDYKEFLMKKLLDIVLSTERDNWQNSRRVENGPVNSPVEFKHRKKFSQSWSDKHGDSYLRDAFFG